MPPTTTAPIPVPTTAVPDISDYLEVNATQVVTGGNVEGTLVINNAGGSVDLTPLTGEPYPGCQGPVCHCTPDPPGVELIGQYGGSSPAFNLDCGSSPFIIGHGTTRFPWTISTVANSCTGPEGPIPVSAPNCVPGAPLPPGVYQAQAVWSPSVPIPSPQPVTVTLSAL